MENYLKKVSLKYEETNVKMDFEKIGGPNQSVDVLRQIIGDSIDIHESFVCIFLNHNMNPIGWSKISTGGITECTVDVRIIFSMALNCLATGIIVCHNHPSGSLNPSSYDKRFTKELKEIGNLLRIKIIDHVILTKTSFYSFAEDGWMDLI